jgi:hypothetical protein
VTSPNQIVEHAAAGAQLPDLMQRLSAYFSNGPFMRGGQDITVTMQQTGHGSISKLVHFSVVFNVAEGYVHYALVGSQLGLEWAHFAEAGRIKAYAKEFIAGVDIQWGWTGSPTSELDRLDALPFSKRVYIFTDKLSIPKATIVRDLTLRGMKAVILDDEAWAERNATRKPDVFLTHDWRDKDPFVRQLHIELARRQLKVWYDETSLRPGDQLSASIDKGLTECRHAVIVVSPHLLENNGWGQTELSTLLTRAVSQKQLILPIWLDVTKAQVAERSARLADLVAIDGALGVEKIADKIYTTVGGPVGLRK